MSTGYAPSRLGRRLRKHGAKHARSPKDVNGCSNWFRAQICAAGLAVELFYSALKCSMVLTTHPRILHKDSTHASTRQWPRLSTNKPGKKHCQHILNLRPRTPGQGLNAAELRDVAVCS